jgi:hypothetical protein
LRGVGERGGGVGGLTEAEAGRWDCGGGGWERGMEGWGAWGGGWGAHRDGVRFELGEEDIGLRMPPSSIFILQNAPLVSVAWSPWGLNGWDGGTVADWGWGAG